MLPFPNKKYNIIYADPPWEYKDKALSGSRGACCKYDVMSLNDICVLPIDEIANNDCVLFLWVTNPHLPDAFTVINAWGFIYKTVAFTWIKRTKHNKLHWGMGHWTRSNSEICLLAIKGKPKRKSASIHSVIETLDPLVIDSVLREHSRKPDQVRDKIVELVGDLPRIELFATKRFIGWDSWGYGVMNTYMKRAALSDW